MSGEENWWNRSCTQICLLWLSTMSGQMIWRHCYSGHGLWFPFSLSRYMLLDVKYSQRAKLKLCNPRVQSVMDFYAWMQSMLQLFVELKMGSSALAESFSCPVIKQIQMLSSTRVIYKPIILISCIGCFLHHWHSCIFVLKRYTCSLTHLYWQECSHQVEECESFCHLADYIGSALCSFGYLWVYIKHNYVVNNINIIILTSRHFVIPSESLSLSFSDNTGSFCFVMQRFSICHLHSYSFPF